MQMQKPMPIQMESEITPKVITIELPRRNKILFSSFDTLDETILNEPLVSLIALLKFIIPESILAPVITTPGSRAKYNTTIELCRNHLNFIMRITTKDTLLPSIILKHFQTNKTCCHLEINGRIYKTGFYKDILSLEYYPFSFRQPDDSIREYMIQWMQRNFSYVDLLVLIGGECTLFGKILSRFTKDTAFLTDFQSIADDVQRNYKSPMVELIDYDKWKLAESKLAGDKLFTRTDTYNKKKDIASIINTGFRGMGRNLAMEICRLDASKLYVISCNPDSWQSDWSILNRYYKLEDVLEIRTNYSVWIYVLQICI